MTAIALVYLVVVELDIVVRIDSSTICGTDLHILKGGGSETGPGTVQEIGRSVGTVAVGDRRRSSQR